MAAEVQVVTDSASCLQGLAPAAELGVHVVPQWVHIGDRSYRDGELTPREVWQALDRGEKVSTTQPAVRDFVDLYRQLGETAGIVVLTIASRLSSTFSTASLAAELCGLERLRLVDSQTALGALGLVTLAAARAARHGADLPAVEAQAKEAAGRVRLFAALETLEPAARSGRVPSLAAHLGNMVRLYPVFELRRGQPRLRGWARRFEEAVDRMVRVAEGSVDLDGAEVFLVHGEAPERAEAVASTLRARHRLAAVYQASAPASVSVHLGPGAVTLAVLRAA